MNIHSNPLQVPIIKTYHFPAFILAIMQNNEKSFDWIFSNYIQTCFQIKNNPIPFYYFIFDINLSPWIKLNKIPLVKFIEGDILKRIEKIIIKGGYIRLSMDQFFIPNRIAYKKTHYNHDDLIYGIDFKNELVKLYGYSDKKVMEKTVVPFDDFLKGIHNLNHDYYFLDEVEIFSLNSNCTYSMDKMYVKSQLIDYVESYETAQHFAWFDNFESRSWGISTYDKFPDHFKAVLKKCNHSINDNDKIINFFYEHKKVMLERLIFVQGKYNINMNMDISEYKKVVELSYYFREHFIEKDNFMESKYDIYINIVKYCKQKEKEILERVINYL